MFDTDGDQRVDKKEFLVVSTTAQNRLVMSGFIGILEMPFCTDFKIIGILT